MTIGGAWAYFKKKDVLLDLLNAFPIVCCVHLFFPFSGPIFNVGFNDHDFVFTGFFSGFMLKYFIKVNGFVDCFPSLHAILVLTTLLGLKYMKLPRWVLICWAIFTILTIISTWFLGHHYYFDTLGSLVYCFVYHKYLATR